MTNKGLINEVFWLRTLACLAVTLGHAFNSGYNFYSEPTIYHVAVYILNMAVLFGVPVFVFISEFLLAHKYSNIIPTGFLKKRVKILMLPYLFMSVIYGITSVEAWTIQEVVITLSSSIFLGESPVYFILIIFQFYLLHMLFGSYLMRLSPKMVIPLAFLINFLYLAFFNFVEPPNNSITNFIWSFGYWLPFIGWFFYFILGFYCGKNWIFILNMLRSKYWIIIPPISLVIMLLINKYFLVDQDSKRVDMLIYASSVIFFIMFVSSRMQKVPKLIMIISNYSFSIFLLHMLFVQLLSLIEPPSFLNIFTYSLSVFLLSLLLSISSAKIINRFKYGKYFVGQILKFNINNNYIEKSNKGDVFKDDNVTNINLNKMKILKRKI